MSFCYSLQDCSSPYASLLSVPYQAMISYNILKKLLRKEGLFLFRAWKITDLRLGSPAGSGTQRGCRWWKKISWQAKKHRDREAKLGQRPQNLLWASLSHDTKSPFIIHSTIHLLAKT